jgi:hypothetical protein
MAYDETQRRISLDSDASIGIRTGPPGMPGSLDPNGGKQYYFVKVTGEHLAGLVSAAGGASIGVLQNKPQNVGEAASIAISGVSYVVAGATLVGGDPVMSGADGRANKWVTTNTQVGTCILGAGAGQLAAVLLQMN